LGEIQVSGREKNGLIKDSCELEYLKHDPIEQGSTVVKTHCEMLNLLSLGQESLKSTFNYASNREGRNEERKL
jgi:hypothetical protein